VHIYALCTLHLGLHWLLLLLSFFTMGGQLRWALCLSGNPPLCVLLVSLFSAIVFVLWRIKLHSLSLSSRLTDSSTQTNQRTSSLTTQRWHQFSTSAYTAPVIMVTHCVTRHLVTMTESILSYQCQFDAMLPPHHCLHACKERKTNTVHSTGFQLKTKPRSDAPQTHRGFLNNLYTSYV